MLFERQFRPLHRINCTCRQPKKQIRRSQTFRTTHDITRFEQTMLKKRRSTSTSSLSISLARQGCLRGHGLTKHSQSLACEIYADPILDSRWEDVGVFAIGILEVEHPHILLDIPSGRNRRALGFLGSTTLFNLVVLLGISG